MGNSHGWWQFLKVLNEYSSAKTFTDINIFTEETAADQVLNVYQCGGSLITPNVVLTGNSTKNFL